MYNIVLLCVITKVSILKYYTDVKNENKNQISNPTIQDDNRHYLVYENLTMCSKPQPIVMVYNIYLIIK